MKRLFFLCTMLWAVSAAAQDLIYLGRNGSFPGTCRTVYRPDIDTEQVIILYSDTSRDRNQTAFLNGQTSIWQMLGYLVHQPVPHFLTSGKIPFPSWWAVWDFLVVPSSKDTITTIPSPYALPIHTLPVIGGTASYVNGFSFTGNVREKEDTLVTVRFVSCEKRSTGLFKIDNSPYPRRVYKVFAKDGDVYYLDEKKRPFPKWYKVWPIQ